MPVYEARDLATLLGGRLYAPGELTVEGACHDSRLVQPGNLFIALRGQQRDGHDFVTDAFHRGARLALVERPVEGPHLLVANVQRALRRFVRSWRQRYRGKVIAVTGSVGKTTTKELLRAVLGGPTCVFATPGNFNTEIGIPLALLQGMDAQPYAVFEVGMRGPGEIHDLAGLLTPNVGVITNVSMSHVGLLGSVDRIARAKAELLGRVPADGWAVLPREDQWFPLLRLFAPRHLLTVGRSSPADLLAEAVSDLGVEGWRFRVAGLEIQCPWPGEGALVGTLLALGVAKVLGVPLEDCRDRLAGLSAPPRLRSLQVDGLEVWDDTYNASPVSMAVALRLLASRPGRRVAVLGDMFELGEDAPRYHAEVGGLAAQHADYLLAVGALAKEYAAGALRAGMPAERVYHLPHLEAADAFLATFLKPGDVVLIKGARAMALDRLVASIERRFRP